MNSGKTETNRAAMIQPVRPAWRLLLAMPHHSKVARVSSMTKCRQWSLLRCVISACRPPCWGIFAAPVRTTAVNCAPWTTHARAPLHAMRGSS